MLSPHERLRTARERAGYENAKIAAEAMGTPVSTYIQHENGTRGFPASKADKYARFYRADPAWLLYGKGDEPKPNPNIDELTRIVRDAVAAMPVTASMGDLPRHVAMKLSSLWEAKLDRTQPPRADSESIKNHG